MEAIIIFFIFLVIFFTLWYLKPLIVHRLKTKKIKLVLISKDGKEKVNTLYLYHNDPLWKAIKIHQGVENEQ
ncbi:putative uncharacterized phage protein [Moritella viscosa]|nr:hypothetical protein [Moritella viscosa]CED59827.1 putative uncharacterized phage protein [Moritella viscosa]